MAATTTMFTFQVEVAIDGSNMTNGMMDLMCYHDGNPLACMVVFDGQLQSETIHYYNAPHSRFSEHMTSHDYIEAHQHTIRAGCKALLKDR
jgi:hypothetical protein